nr:tetratricopeptide repeat protein [Rhodobaculum claviforme]
MAPPQRVPSSPAPAETTGPDEGGTPEAGADDPFADLPGLLKTRLTAEAILRRVAVLFEKSDDFTTALAVLERAHRLNPDSPEIARRLAQCRARSARRHG